MLVTILTVLAGGVMIVFVMLDIFTTVLHPEAKSPLSNRFQQLVWRMKPLLTSL